MKIALVTDSVAYLSQEEINQMAVSILPLSIEFQGNVYVEGEDLTPTEFYNLVRGAETLPKSSQPTIGKTMALFEQLSKDYDAVIAVTLSSGISGTFQTVKSLDGECNKLPVYAIDSKRAAGSQRFLIKRAYQLIQKGLNIDDIVADLNQFIDTQGAYFIVDDLKHLQKGGRLSASSAFIGSMLSIKPILTINDTIVATEKIRSMKKGLVRVSQLLGQHVTQFPNLSFVATIHHANCLDLAKQFMAQLQEEYPTIQFDIVEFGQTLGTHLGEGAIGVSFSADPMK